MIRRLNSMRRRLGVLRDIFDLFHRDLGVYRRVLKDPRTPRGAKVFLALAIGYALLPFDLIPDWIPIIGWLDDAVIVPLLLLFALKRIPPQVIADARKNA